MAETDFREYRYSDLEYRLVVPAIGNDPYMGIAIPAEGSFAGTILSDIPDEAVGDVVRVPGEIDDRWGYMEKLVRNKMPVHKEHIEVRGNFGFVDPDEYGTSHEIYSLSGKLRESPSTAFGVDMKEDAHGNVPAVGLVGLDAIYGRRRFIEEFPFTDNSHGPTSPWISVLDIYNLRTFIWGEGPARQSKNGETLQPVYNARKYPTAVYATTKIVFQNPALIEV